MNSTYVMCCFGVFTEPLFALSRGPPWREGKRSSVAKKAKAGIFDVPCLADWGWSGEFGGELGRTGFFQNLRLERLRKAFPNCFKGV